MERTLSNRWLKKGNQLRIWMTTKSFKWYYSLDMISKLTISTKYFIRVSTLNCVFMIIVRIIIQLFIYRKDNVLFCLIRYFSTDYAMVTYMQYSLYRWSLVTNKTLYRLSPVGSRLRMIIYRLSSVTYNNIDGPQLPMLLTISMVTVTNDTITMVLSCTSDS